MKMSLLNNVATYEVRLFVRRLWNRLTPDRQLAMQLITLAVIGIIACGSIALFICLALLYAPSWVLVGVLLFVVWQWFTD